MSQVQDINVLNALIEGNKYKSCVKEEEYISSKLLDFTKNQKILSLPISTMHRILSKYYQMKKSPNAQMVEYLFRCFDTYGEVSLIFLPFLDNELLTIDHCITLVSKYPHIIKGDLLFKLFQIIFTQTKEMSILMNHQKEQIINLTNQNDNLNEQMKNLKIENDELKEQIKVEKRFRLCMYSPKSIEKFHFHIPIGQKWEIINPTECELSYLGNHYHVKTSSTWDNLQNHHPIHMFNGKKYIENGLQWAPHRDFIGQPSYIQITFSYPVIVNALLITSRWVDETPTMFEIIGCNEDEKYESLHMFYENGWKGNDEKKIFIFANEKKYTIYKIIFYKTTQNNVVCAELNLGEVII